MSKKLVTGIAVLVGALVAGAFIVVPMYEKKQAAIIKENLAGMKPPVQVEKVDLSFFKGQATFEKLRTSIPYMDEVTVNMTIASGTLDAGLSILMNAQKAGPVHIDSMVLKGIKTDYSGAMGGLNITQVATVDTLTAKNTEFDLSFYEKKQIPAFLRSIKIGSAAASNYVIDQKTDLFSLNMQLQAGTTENISLLQMGKSSWHGIKAKVMGSEFSMDSMTMDSMHFPDIIEESKALAAGPELTQAGIEKFRDMWITKLKQQPLSMENVAFNKISLTLFGLEPITLEKLLFNFKISDQQFFISKKMDKLVIPSAVLTELVPLGDLANSIYKKPLELFANLDVNVTLKDGKPNLTLKDSFISETNLGRIALALDMTGDNKDGLMPWTMTDNLLVKKAQFSLESKELLNVAFAAYGGTSPDQVRAMLLQNIASSKAQLRTEPEKAFAAAIEKMIADGGGIAVEFNPKTPIPVTDLTQPAAGLPEAWGVSTKYLPPMK